MYCLYNNITGFSNHERYIVWTCTRTVAKFNQRNEFGFPVFRVYNVSFVKRIVFTFEQTIVIYIVWSGMVMMIFKLLTITCWRCLGSDFVVWIVLVFVVFGLWRSTGWSSDGFESRTKGRAQTKTDTRLEDGMCGGRRTLVKVVDF